MLTLRRWHAWLGLLIAPSILFFAITGALQLFGLHEARGDYKPPALIEKLGSVHKDQVFAAGHHGGDEHHDDAEHHAAAEHDDDADHHAAAEHPDDGDHDDKGSVGTTLLKWYFLIVALGLTASTAIGIWMGVTQLRRPRLAWTLLAIGTAVPVALLLL